MHNLIILFPPILLGTIEHLERDMYLPSMSYTTEYFISTIANNIDILILARFIQEIGLGMVIRVSGAILPDHFN